jgi:hypothetical protein
MRRGNSRIIEEQHHILTLVDNHVPFYPLDLQRFTSVAARRWLSQRAAGVWAREHTLV